MTDIFLSYASEDRERAKKLTSSLEARGWSVWWDRKIVAGQTFDKVIEHHLETAKSVVVLWSNSSVSSEWVKNEAAVALERDVLVPALIDRVKLPLEFRRRQTVDLVGWSGDPRHEAFRALCDGISAATKGTTLPEPTRLPLWTLLTKRRWVAGGASILIVALCVGAYLVSPWRARQTPPVFSGSSDVASDASADVKYSGTAKWGIGDREKGTTRFDLILHIAGADVRGEYSDATGDTGTLKLRIDGNSLHGDIVSSRAGGRCTWRGTLNADASKLDATYHCPDGERGDLSLVRK